MFTEKRIGARATVFDLWQRADAVAGGGAFEQHFVDLRGILFGDFHTKGLLKLGENSGKAVDGITLGLFGAFFILAHLLAPVITGHIVGKTRGVVSGRPGQELQHIRHFLRGEISIYFFFILCLNDAHYHTENQ